MATLLAPRPLGPFRGRLPRIVWAVGLLALLLAPLRAMAATVCSAPTPITVSLGVTSSPAAFKVSTPTYTATPTSFSCPSGGVLSLFSTSYLKATVTAPTGGFKITSGGGDTIEYTVAAKSSGTPAFTSGTPVFLISGSSIDLVGLVIGAVGIPVYVKPVSGGTVAPGDYTGAFTIKWEWYFCSLMLNGNCIGSVETDSKTATVTVTMKLVAKPPTISIASSTTWDPLSNTLNPKAIPGGKKRTTVTVTNTDTVPLDATGLAIVLATPPGAAISLTGDGANSNPFVLTEGFPSSNLTFSYVSPGNTGDNVEFSTDSQAHWDAVPTAGTLASEKLVTHVRLKPQGSMAAGSSFKLSVAYQLY